MDTRDVDTLIAYYFQLEAYLKVGRVERITDIKHSHNKLRAFSSHRYMSIETIASIQTELQRIKSLLNGE